MTIPPFNAGLSASERKAVLEMSARSIAAEINGLDVAGQLEVLTFAHGVLLVEAAWSADRFERLESRIAELEAKLAAVKPRGRT